MATVSRPSLLITPEAYDAMVSHCVSGSALATCGILAGAPHTATAAYPLRNVAKSAARYDADPRDMISTHRDLQKRGLEMVAIYHCRPNTAAMPTPVDLRENGYGSLPRVIVALGDPPSIRVWRLSKRYCEELTWRLQVSDEKPIPEGAGAYDTQPEGGEESAGQASTSYLGWFLSWLFPPRRPTGAIPIGRLREFPALKPEPLWDPSLDHPRGGPEIPRG